ncbi:MAG TPA: membrane dipeptidase [Vicinamibacterales bacterium]|nr:membrane dipeptidase [Vicinamibacterales bacterium]
MKVAPPIMSRRQFAAVLSAVPLAAAMRGAAAVQEDVSGLYERAIVIDALANPGSMNVSWPPRGPLSQKQRDAIAASGITAINVTVSADFEGSVRNIALWQGEADKYPNLLSIVRRHSDIAKAKKDKTLGLMLGFQNTDMIDRDISRLDLFYRLGIRIIQLTYNDRNLVGDGCLEPGNAGLSAFGRQVVERMNELGIAVDLSHCGTQTTADGIAASTKPPLITHSGCREVFRHPRSKEDRELKAMADKGGVIGIYFMPFIGPGPGAPTVDMLLRQIDHAIKVCGADHVGIGSDLSVTPIEETPEYLREHKSFVEARARRGISAPEESRPLFIPELNHPRRLEGVVRGMRQRGHSTAVIEKVIGGNFHRVLKEIWTL